MALSMTGFGRGTFANESFAIRIELRAVNHRFLEINLRLPRGIAQCEDRLRRAVNARLNRGKVDVYVHFEPAGAGAASVRLDGGMAAGYRTALLELAARFELPADLEIKHFVQLPDIFVVEPPEVDEESLWEGLSTALATALEQLTLMRRTEGEKLVADLLERVAALDGLAGIIVDKAPSVPEAYRLQLQRRLTEVLGGIELDQTRLAQEVAIYADRCCIVEEIVRLRSHLDQLRETLRMDGALGRKAEFILQEINREINTIGSKANDLTIAQAVIEAKTQLEKIREQVQNLE